PDGRTVATTDGGTIILWDPITGRVHRRIQPNEPNVFNNLTALAFAPDGSVLAAAVEVWRNSERVPGRFVRCWNPSTGKEMNPFWPEGRAAASLAFSPDGRTLAVGDGEGTVQLVEFATGATAVTLRGHRPGVRTPGDRVHRGVTSLSFSPDGRRLVT